MLLVSCLDSNEREKTMNGYYLNKADGNTIQSPVALESTKKTLDRASPIVDSFPLIGFR